ncbi:hypothetical protein OROHE_018852 [Orobanche hederae]
MTSSLLQHLPPDLARNLSSFSADFTGTSIDLAGKLPELQFSPPAAASKSASCPSPQVQRISHRRRVMP